MAERRPVVALVTDSIHPFHRGGKEIRYHEIAHRLAERADVHVYTMNWWQGARERREGNVTYHAIAPLLPLYSGPRRSVRQAVVFALSCLRLLGRRFDVIEADHMPYLQLFPLRLVATVRRKRLLVTWHEFWGPEGWREYLGPAGRIGWLVERTAMRLPDAIIAASAETADRLRAHLGSHAEVTVAPNGVDLRQIGGAVATGAPADLVVVGRLLPHKRVDLLLGAVAILREEGMPVTCRVIGDGPQLADLQARAAALGISSAVDFRYDLHGQDALYSALKAARVFVFPSAREGFGIAVLEALACGLPVITTSAPDNLARHLVKRSDRSVVCAPEAGALADAVREVLERSPHAAVASEDEWLSEFDWRAITDSVAKAVLA